MNAKMEFFKKEYIFPKFTTWTRITKLINTALKQSISIFLFIFKMSHSLFLTENGKKLFNNQCSTFLAFNTIFQNCAR